MNSNTRLVLGSPSTGPRLGLEPSASRSSSRHTGTSRWLGRDQPAQDQARLGLPHGWTTTVACLSVMALGSLSGCLMEAPEAAGQGAGETGIEGAAAALTSATPRGGVGTVFIAIDDGGEYQQCTGFLIGDSTVITASHCFDGPLGHAWSGTVDLRLNLAHTDGVGATCITESPTLWNGTCSAWMPFKVQRLISIGSSGWHDPHYDFAAIFPAPGETFKDVSAADGVLGLATNVVKPGDPYVLFGRGCSTEACDDDEGDVMRYKWGTFQEVHAGKEYAVDYPTQSATCHGDSGGPLFHPFVPIVYGVHHGSKKSKDGQSCGNLGEEQWDNLFTGIELIYLNYWRALQGLPACQPDARGIVWTCA